MKNNSQSIYVVTVNTDANLSSIDHASKKLNRYEVIFYLSVY